MNQTTYDQIRKEHQFISQLIIEDKQIELTLTYGTSQQAHERLLYLEYQLNYG